MFPLFRELPRSGTLLTWRDIANASLYAVKSDSTFAAAFAHWLSVEKAWLVSSGRAALCLILSELAEQSSRREVIVPAYTCPTVPLSVDRAGLQVRLCDIDLTTGNLSTQRLSKALSNKTLAIVAVHMNGIPCDMRVILDIARQYDVFVVEDCAQAVGATIAMQRVGTYGDAAFFSLGKGKGFPAYEGGIGIGELGSKGEEKQRNIGAELLILIKLVAMVMFFHPNLYWIIRALPLGWDNEVYSGDFAIRSIGRFRQGIAFSLLRRLEWIVEERRKKAKYLRDRLLSISSVQLLKAPAGSKPSYPWLPLLLEKRNEAVLRLRARGLGAYQLFTCSLNQYDYLRGIVQQESFPEAEYMSAHLLTLPIHEYVTRKDMDQMVTVLTEMVC